MIPRRYMPLSDDGAVLLLKDGDNVAVALRTLEAACAVSLGTHAFATCGRIEAGHKLAVRAIGAGDAILKYGETMGRATSAIAPGEHVHVHNVEGLRGRGDLAEPARQ